MSTKSKSQANEAKFERDLAAFEDLPEKTKELMNLKEEDERTSGSEKNVITEKIEDKTD